MEISIAPEAGEISPLLVQRIGQLVVRSFRASRVNQTDPLIVVTMSNKNDAGRLIVAAKAGSAEGLTVKNITLSQLLSIFT